MIHHRIIRADEFITTNSQARFNEQQVCWSIIVFVYAYWDEEIRQKIADIRGIAKNEVRVDVFGDLRILRQSIVHHGGRLEAANYTKLKVLNHVCHAGKVISPTHDEMHKIFVAIKSAIGALILEYTGHLPGAPRPVQIVDLAVQSAGANGPERANE